MQGRKRTKATLLPPEATVAINQITVDVEMIESQNAQQPIYCTGTRVHVYTRVLEYRYRYGIAIAIQPIVYCPYHSERTSFAIINPVGETKLHEDN